MNFKNGSSPGPSSGPSCLEAEFFSDVLDRGGAIGFAVGKSPPDLAAGGLDNNNG